MLPWQLLALSWQLLALPWQLLALPWQLLALPWQLLALPKRELSIQEGRIENDSDQKFSKAKVFLKNHFFPWFMSPWSLWAESTFSIFEVRIYPSIYTILDSTFQPPPPPPVMRSRKAGVPCNTSSEAGALDTGGTYREWLGPKIF